MIKREEFYEYDIHHNQYYGTSRKLLNEKIKRGKIIVELAKYGINTNVHYKPLPMMTAYKKLGWDIKDFPNAYDYYKNLITLPLHTLLSDEDVEYVIHNYKQVIRKYI